MNSEEADFGKMEFNLSGRLHVDGGIEISEGVVESRRASRTTNSLFASSAHSVLLEAQWIDVGEMPPLWLTPYTITLPYRKD